MTRRSPQTGEPFNRLPAALYDTRVKIDQRLIDSFPPSVPAEVVHEFSEGQWAGLARLLESRTDQRAPIRTTPSIVLTRGEHEDWFGGEPRRCGAAVHQLAACSGGRAGHEIHLFVPAAVTRAIQDVVTVAREAGACKAITPRASHPLLVELKAHAADVVSRINPVSAMRI